MDENGIVYTPEDLNEMYKGVYGEAAGADDAVMKMVAQSIVNRHRSGRGKEFGETIPDIMKRGYYAVSKANKPYKEASEGKFPDIKSKAAWGRTKKLVDIASSETDTDNPGHLFYFTPEEEAKMKKNKSFKFDQVEKVGKIGGYNLYKYK